MSGVLGLTTPWSRQYFPADLRPEVEALVPDGHTLTVGARAKPGEWTLVLSRDPTPDDIAAGRHGAEIHRATVYGKDLPYLCASTLRRWDVASLTVTTDAEGWVREIA